jgi:hypothetical protein
MSHKELTAEKVKICKTLTRPVATCGGEPWTLNTDIAKWLAAFERKVLRRMFGGINPSENWRRRYNKELTQLCGDLDMLSFARISLLNWIGRVNTMGSKRKVSQVFNNNRHGSRLKGRS